MESRQPDFSNAVFSLPTLFPKANKESSLETKRLPGVTVQFVCSTMPTMSVQASCFRRSHYVTHGLLLWTQMGTEPTSSEAVWLQEGRGYCDPEWLKRLSKVGQGSFWLSIFILSQLTTWFWKPCTLTICSPAAVPTTLRNGTQELNTSNFTHCASPQCHVLLSEPWDINLIGSPNENGRRPRQARRWWSQDRCTEL